VLRLTSQDKPHVLRVFEGVLLLLKRRPLHGHLWMVEGRCYKGVDLLLLIRV
jgi:hypothetical protein